MNDSGIILVGVGGAAIRLVASTARRFGIADAIGFDCDSSSAVPGIDFRLIGEARLDGRGSGGDSVKARAAAQDDAGKFREAAAGARLVVAAVSLGGGFGSGAAPEMVRAMRDAGATVLCIATRPFAFEGAEKDAVARRHLPLLEGAASATAAIAMDDLLAGAADRPIGEAFAAAAAAMEDVLSLCWRLASRPGFISLGAERVAALISEAHGRLRISTGRASGDGRATAAAEALFASRLPGADARPDGVGSAIFGVIAGQDLRLAELTEISQTFARRTPVGVKLDFGVILEDAVSGEITLVCLFFDKSDSIAPQEPAAQGEPGAQPRHGRRGRRDPLLDASTGARFKGLEGTIFEGQDLDIPTYLRRNLPLEK